MPLDRLLNHHGTVRGYDWTVHQAPVMTPLSNVYSRSSFRDQSKTSRALERTTTVNIRKGSHDGGLVNGPIVSSDSTMMIQKAIKRHGSYPTKKEVWNRLPRRMQYQTFNRVLDYLESSGEDS